MIDKKIIIGILIGLLIAGTLLLGLWIYQSKGKAIEKSYFVGYQNCSNNTLFQIWNDMADDNCVTLPVPIQDENNQTTIQNARFCYQKGM